jgi:hypothetical protein
MMDSTNNGRVERHRTGGAMRCRTTHGEVKHGGIELTSKRQHGLSGVRTAWPET